MSAGSLRHPLRLRVWHLSQSPKGLYLYLNYTLWRKPRRAEVATPIQLTGSTLQVGNEVQTIPDFGTRTVFPRLE
jgi:hypothetical protein